MQRFFLVLFLFLMILVPSCCSKKQVHASQPTVSVRNTNPFGISLYQVVSKSSKGNVFFSPYSLAQALTMAMEGAAGKTALEMQRVLQIPAEAGLAASLFNQLNTSFKEDSQNISSAVANAIWVQEAYPFLQSYLDMIQRNYGAYLGHLDFVSPNSRESSRIRINEWTSEKTQGYIEDLLPRGSLTEQTRMVLTNAIFFSAHWKTAFDPGLNVDLPFILPDRTKIPSVFMNLKDTLGYKKLDGFRILDLPYAGDNVSMTILLPDDWDGIFALERKLSNQNLTEWLSGLERKEVTLYLPRWKVAYDFDASRMLSEMGIADAFTLDADFSGMTGRKDLYISKVLHKAFIDVTEKGTEAAAASAVIMAEKASGSNEERIYFRADHPFLYLIRDKKTQQILFIGRLSDPA